MSIHLFLILSAFSLSLSLPQDLRACTSEKEALEWIDNWEQKGAEPYDKSFPSISMNRGWWDVTERLVLIAHEKKIDVSSSIYRTSSVIKNEIKRIIDVLNTAGKEWPEISPAFQWTQSNTHLFLNVKFAARWDTPSTLDCFTDVYNLTETTLIYQAKCNTTRKVFLLSIPFWKNVDPSDSSNSLAAVGRITFTIRKALDGNWGTLMKGKKPGNMHVWWAMEEQVEKEPQTHTPNPPKPSIPETPQVNNTNVIDLNGTSGSFSFGAENMTQISKEEFDSQIQKNNTST